MMTEIDMIALIGYYQSDDNYCIFCRYILAQRDVSGCTLRECDYLVKQDTSRFIIWTEVGARHVTSSVIVI